MAQPNKKRAKELQQDVFRDRSLGLLEKAGDALEGKGRLLLIALGGLIAALAVVGLISWRNDRRDQEAQLALGRAIEISEATIGPAATPAPGDVAGMNFATRGERAKRAVEEFNKVADKYGDPFRSKAKYLAAVNLLTVDRARGVTELENLQRNGGDDVVPWATFALAQAREENGEYDAAATLYNQLAQKENPALPTDLAKERLAAVYEKAGKKQEAVNLLYGIVEASRKAKDNDGKPVQPSSTARAAEQRLQTLDPARYAQLPAAPSPMAGLNL